MNLPDNPLSISETFKTAGELKAFLAMFPEDMPLFTDTFNEPDVLEGVHFYCHTVSKVGDDFMQVDEGEGFVVLTVNTY